MKNIQSVTFALDIVHWLSDDDHAFRNIPKKIKQLAENHYPLQYVIDPTNVDDDCFHLTFNNVPKTFVTYVLMAYPGITVAEQIEYCNIHPEALHLFDFGDDN